MEFYGYLSLWRYMRTMTPAGETEVTLPTVLEGLSLKASVAGLFLVFERGGHKLCVSLGCMQLHAGDCASISPTVSSYYWNNREELNRFFAHRGIARVHLVFEEGQGGFIEMSADSKSKVLPDGSTYYNVHGCKSTRNGCNLRTVILDLSTMPGFYDGYPSFYNLFPKTEWGNHE